MKRIPFGNLKNNVQGLPRLPVPTLDDTFARYVASVTPLKKNDKVSKHLSKLEAFKNGSAAKLQSVLLTDDAVRVGYPHSYIESLWDTGYLEFRVPSPINVSPAFCLKPLFKGKSQSEVAASVVHSLQKLLLKYTTEGVDVPVAVDVSQLSSQFCFSRVPLPKRDELVVYDVTSAKNIAVLRAGQIFLVRIYDDNGTAISQLELKRSFEEILLSTSDANTSIAALTSISRDDWSACIIELEKDPHNFHVLESIRQCVIILCLDRECWATDNAAKQKAMLHGGPEAENRWYDKHQLIVSADGQVAVNFEHAFSDGATWSRWISEICSDLSGSPSVYSKLPTLPVSCQSHPVTPIALNIGQRFSSQLRSAHSFARSLGDTVVLETLVLPYGKESLKQKKISPDAFFQMSLHLAHFRMTDKLAPAYESCSTAKFFHGRTETIRSATIQVRDVTSLVTQNASHNTIKEALLRMSLEHQAQAKRCAAGQGIDRHLLALKDIAGRTQDIDALDFFSDSLYKSSCTWKLSTSNVSQPFLDLFNFGPVVPDGYGIGYIIDDHEMRACISTFSASSNANAFTFAAALARAAEELFHVLD